MSGGMDADGTDEKIRWRNERMMLRRGLVFTNAENITDKSKDVGIHAI